MLVVDAGVVVAALIGQGDLATMAQQHLANGAAAPELIDLEVGSALRRLVHQQRLSAARGRAALDDLADLPLERAPHRQVLSRCWQLRDALSFYDAAYVALAETLGCTLVTTDRPLSRAPGVRCAVEVLTPAS